MLLIYPAVAKACEPPAGIAYLAGALRNADVFCEVIDLNVEMLMERMDAPDHFCKYDVAGDTWTKRAIKNSHGHMQALRSRETYNSADKYKRAVLDLNRILLKSTDNSSTITLGNYTSSTLSATSVEDLKTASVAYTASPFYEQFKKIIDEKLQDNRHKHVGLSINFLNQALTAFSIAGYIRNHYPEIQLIAGGGLVTTWASMGQLENLFGTLFDKVIPGRAVNSLLRFLGKEECTASFLPDYSDLVKNHYLAPGFILPYTTTSGCPWSKCAFCPETAEKNSFTAVSPTTVVQQVQQLCALYSPSLIHFLDNALPPKTLVELVQLEGTTPWYGFVRLHKRLTDLDFCKALRKAGCTMLKLGIESGSDKVLHAMRKGTTVTLASQVLNTLHKAGIASYVYLLFGTPSETLTKARETLQFTVEHAEAITLLNLAVFNMVLTSPDAALYEAEPFSRAELSLYGNFVHPAGWDRKSVRLFLQEEFKSHPQIKPILHADPPLFTSNHAPFFTL